VTRAMAVNPGVLRSVRTARAMADMIGHLSGSVSFR